MALRQVADSSQDTRSFLPPILFCEPSWRFVAEEEANKHKDSGYSLHRKRNQVPRFACDVEDAAVVDYVMSVVLRSYSENAFQDLLQKASMIPETMKS